MEFHVLGSLAVRDAAGTEVPLPRDKQRVLLAALLLNHGRVVPRDRLVELLWPGTPPASAATALYGHVSQLRKLLGRDRLETRPPGYVLRADDDEVDVRRFEAFVAAERFRDALALWRGTPYAELEEQPFVHAERERLRELRLFALEEALAGEAPAAAIPELEALVVEHPFRERLHGLLMLALYRAGRQADALAVYRALRSAYVEELGIEPGAELQQLERQILNQDPRLDGRTPRRAAPLPTGTVTFVFTDIERSTELLHELGGEAYAELLASHHQCLRSLVGEHGGVEVDTQGDGSFAAFARATDALGAAAAMHRDAPIRIRIGIHTGEPVVTDDGYVGADVHLAARIAAAGHGGQTLLSSATRALAHHTSLRDLGEHRFKGFAQRERVWQVGEDDFPPLRAAAPTNLPPATAALYGRERELREIDGLLRSGTKLLTLTGPGGSGKTQLALHAARALDDLFADGVFFVDLAPLGHVSLVAPAIALALGVGEHELDAVLLHGNRLVVLDNAEHLGQTGSVVAPWLSGASAFLVTSRAPLHLRFEHRLEVEPLADAAAAELFVSRAAAAGRRIAADATVRTLCRRLDNLPLALELAAARAKHLDPEEILEHGALATGPDDAPDRQRTLHNTIEWSYRLLAPGEQRALGALAVFNGGWTLDAAASVADASVDILAALVDQSLVRRGPGRFDMLDTIRGYARGHMPSETAARHAAYFAGFAERMAAELAGSDQRSALRRLDLDLGNLRAALEWSREHDPATMARIALALPRFWQSRGLLSEARRWLDATIDVAEDRLDALYQAGNFARLDGDLERARRLHEAALAGAEPSAAHRYLMSLGQVESILGNLDAARSHLDRALALPRSDDARMHALTVVSLGAVELELGNHGRALELTTEGVAGLRAVSDDISVALVLPALAYLQERTGSHDAALASWREALDLAVAHQSWITAAWALLVAAFVEAGVEPHVAARWLGAAEAAWVENAWTWEAAELRVREETAALLSARLGAAASAAARAEGAQLGMKRALNEARVFRETALVSADSR